MQNLDLSNTDQFNGMSDQDAINLQLQQITNGIYTNVQGTNMSPDESMITGHVKVQMNVRELQTGLDDFFTRPDLLDFLLSNDITQSWSSKSVADVYNNPFWYFYGAPDIVSSDIGFAESAGINLLSTQCLSVNGLNYNHPVGAIFKFILGKGSGPLSVNDNNYFIVDIEFGGSQVNNIINYVEGDN